MKTYFKIGNINICIESPIVIKWNKYVKEFICDEQCYDVYYRIVLTNSFQYTGNCVYSDNFQEIYVDSNHEYRLHYFYGFDDIMLMYDEYEDNRLIYINEKYLSAFMLEENYSIFNALAFEKVLLHRHSIVLHCSYVVDNDEAILFSAPSGTGKSTQARLWHQYENAVIVNGDRAIIQKYNNVYYAVGLPICGSSDVCLNRKAKIKAIVYLYQNDTNRVEKLDMVSSYKKIMSETTIGLYDSRNAIKAFDIVEDIACHVPTYLLGCTPDKYAVQCLKEVLDCESN